jgi:segregation and condensation protein A
LTPDVFEIRLPVFEGPLDLLLHLLEKEELEITSVSLLQVTDQYLSYLHSLDEINMDALADFIAVGAKLLLLKSRALLPREPGAPEESEEEDVGEELARLLVEYRRFREAASQLREREDQGLHSYPRLAPPPEVPLSLGLDRLTLRKLTRIFREALRRLPAEEAGTINRQEVSVQEKVEEILTSLARWGHLSFRRLVSACRTRLEVIVSFLAVLELIKSNRLRAEQSELFGDIQLLASEETPAPQ